MDSARTGVVLICWEQPADEVVQATRRLGAFGAVAAGCLEPPSAASEGGRAFTVGQAVAQILTAEVDQVVLMPTLGLGANHQVRTRLAAEVARCQAAHPNVEFMLVTPALDPEQHAQLLLRALRQADRDQGDAELVPLSLLPAQRRCTVQRLRGGQEFISRLAALGFIPGCPVQVVQNYGVGPLIVMVRDTRLALGREEARKIRVRVDNDDRAHHAVPAHGHRQRHGGYRE